MFFSCCAFMQNIKAQQLKTSYFGSFEFYNPIKFSTIKPSSVILVKEKPLPRSLLYLDIPKEMPVAFFCIKEHHMDKKHRINPRFRLGSVDYVNQLEGRLNQIK